MSKLADGIHAGLSRDDYDDELERVNFSTLKMMDRSPAHYRHNLIHQRSRRRLAQLGQLDDDDTDAKQRGRVVSMAVFEPEAFRERVCVYTGGQRRGRSWEEFILRNPDREIVTEAQHQHAITIARHVRSSPQARLFLDRPGRGEVTVAWTHRSPTVFDIQGYEIACKGRIDYLGDGFILDLKTTKSADQRGFGRECANYLTTVQAAMYTDAIEQRLGRRFEYYLVAIEPVAPYVSQVYQVTPAQLAHGRDVYTGWLDRLNVCRRDQEWPAFGSFPMQLELPGWFNPDDEDDLS